MFATPFRISKLSHEGGSTSRMFGGLAVHPLQTLVQEGCDPAPANKYCTWSVLHIRGEMFLCFVVLHLHPPLCPLFTCAF